MAQETFFDKVREFIGSIAWSIFLWSIRMSEDEYLDAVVRESGLTQRSPDVGWTCENGHFNPPQWYQPFCLYCKTPRG